MVDPEYCLALAAEDLAVLGLEGDRQPRIGKDVLVLALLSVRDGFPVTANLNGAAGCESQNLPGAAGRAS